MGSALPSIIPSWPLGKWIGLRDRIEVPEGFHVFRGIEISTDRGHLLVYGLKDDSWNIWSRSQYLGVFEVVEIVHRFGGICVPAHPFRGWDSFGEDVLKIDGLDAIETHNGLDRETANRKAMEAARLKKLPSIGGSDCHIKEQVGTAFTLFKTRVETIEDLIEEIKKGNCEGAFL
jgi:predicted metal-dependent phosphoesterase TrpH